MQLPKNLSKEKQDMIKTPFKLKEVDETNKTGIYELKYLPDEEEEVKYNKYLVRLIRSSFEYKRFIGILKNEMNMTRCKFIPIADNDESKVTIEMHHYPFTLYDIVAGIRNKMKEENRHMQSFHTFKIVEKVMRLHFEGKVGIVPLSKTIHELAHSGEVSIPLEKGFVYGDWEALLRDELKIENSLIEHLNIIKKFTEDYKKDPSILDLSILDTVNTKIIMKKAEKPLKIRKSQTEAS